MLRLRGKSFGSGMALGSASVLRAPHGIPLLPASMVAQMARTPRDVPVEPMEVVLIAEDYDAARSLALPWARVVGIVAERTLPDAVRPGVPTVVGVEGLMNKVDDEALVLIDGDHGVVLVDPDPAAVATYQAERERIAPRRRIYLDFAHQPARTLDGREVRVTARVSTLEEAAAAVEAGADGLFVPSGSEIVRPDDSDEEQLAALIALAGAAGGKPVTLAGDAQTVSMPSLLRASFRADFTLALPLSCGSEGYAELQEYLAQVREELLAEEVDFAEFRISGATALLEPLTGGLADFALGRVIVDASQSSGLSSAETRVWFDNLVVAANCLLLPVEIALSSEEGEGVEVALGIGAAGFIVPIDQVQALKERLRGLDVNECRASILGGA